jgi:hypothetical protein
MPWYTKGDRRADPTPEAFETWIPAQEVMARAPNRDDRGLAADIWTRLKSGLVAAAATTATWRDERGHSLGRGPTTINPPWWDDAPHMGLPQQGFWRFGTLTLELWDDAQQENVEVSFFDIKLEPDQLPLLAPEHPDLQRVRRMTEVAGGAQRLDHFAHLRTPADATVAPAAPSPTGMAASPNGDARRLVRGATYADLPVAGSNPTAAAPAPIGTNARGAGRRSLPFWEEAILTVAQRMHMGDFKPSSQAEVVRALADWITEQGYPEPGPMQLKQRAKMVFEMFKD